MLPIASIGSSLGLSPDIQSKLTQSVGNGTTAISAKDLASLGKSVGDTAAASAIQNLPDASALSQTQTISPATGGGSFTDVLGQMVSEVNAKQTAANNSVGSLLSGGNVSLHQAMIAMEEANVSFQLMVEVRNKLLDSYQELMRMQV